MLYRIERTIVREDMLSKFDICIIALSGGADSIALLNLLSILKKKYMLDLKAIHVHHGLRGAEADRDAEFAKESARKLGIECKVVYEKVADYASLKKLSLEEAARILRYRALEREAGYLDTKERRCKIAVAHNMEDNAETILMQLSRGSGLQGLSGIPLKRGRIIRPLLEVSRKEIEEYLEKKEIQFITDSTNLEERFTRNKIRRSIIPILSENINSAAVENINRAGGFISAANTYIRGVAEKICDETLVEERGCVSADIEFVLKEPPLIRAYMIMEMLRRISGSLKDIENVHIEDIAALLKANRGKHIDLPYGLSAMRDYKQLKIYDKNIYSGKKNKETYFFEFRKFPYEKESKIPEGDWLKWFDADMIGEDYISRQRQSGDYIELKGVGRKNLRSFMTDIKIPAEERDDLLLLAKGNHIIWIPGKRISEKFKINSYTRNVLEVSCKKINKGE